MGKKLSWSQVWLLHDFNHTFTWIFTFTECGHWQDAARTAPGHLPCPNTSISYELNGACGTPEIRNTRMVISIASKFNSRVNIKAIRFRSLWFWIRGHPLATGQPQVHTRKSTFGGLWTCSINGAGGHIKYHCPRNMILNWHRSYNFREAAYWVKVWTF